MLGTARGTSGKRQRHLIQLVITVVVFTVGVPGVGEFPAEAHSATDNPFFEDLAGVAPNNVHFSNPRVVRDANGWVSYDIKWSPCGDGFGPWSEYVNPQVRALDANGDPITEWMGGLHGNWGGYTTDDCQVVNPIHKDNQEFLSDGVYLEWRIVGDTTGTVFARAKTTAQFEVPTVPGNLRVINVTSCSVSLAWDDSSFETSYELQRSQDSGATWSDIATPNQDETTYTDAALFSSTSFQYRIRAVNANGPSGWSNTVEATTSAAAPCVTYVAFGDSITTGFSSYACNVYDRRISKEGCVDYGQRPSTPYPELVATALGSPYTDLDRVGIWGHTLAEARTEYRDGPGTDDGPWPPQYSVVDVATKLVTGALGINDMKFSDVPFWLSRCQTDSQCLGNVNAVIESDDFQTPLIVMFQRLAAAAARGARPIVTLYYDPIDSMPGCEFTNRISSTIVDRLNLELKEKAVEFGIEFADFWPSFVGHGMGSTDPYVFGKTCRDVDGLDLLPVWDSDPGVGSRVASILYDPHPNCSGGVAMAEAILDAVGNSNPVPECTDRILDPSGSEPGNPVANAVASDQLTTSGGFVPSLLDLGRPSGPQLPKEEVNSEGVEGVASGELLDRVLSLADVADACHRSVGEDGFGTVTLNEHLVIENQRGEIEVPCRVRLGPNGSLLLRNIELRSNHLTITDSDPSGINRVGVEESRLVGVDGAGLYVRLEGPDDAFSVQQSTIDYPRSVWAHVAGEVRSGSTGGMIELRDSLLRSTGKLTEGVMIVSGGPGRFLHLDADTANGGLRLLYGRACDTTDVRGLHVRCVAKT